MIHTLTGAQSMNRPAAGQALTTLGVLRVAAIATSGLVVALLMALPWSPIGKYFSLASSATDYGTHASLAEGIATNGITFPHFLWHLLVVVVHAVGPWLSWMDAARLVVVASYGLQGAALAWILTSTIASPRDTRDVLRVVALALLLVIVAPATILTWRESALYFGYLNMDSYASPTHALLKPLALLAFGFTARAFVEGGRLPDAIVLAAAVALSALAKPSLIICLLPATFVLGAWHWLRGGRLQLSYLLGAVFLPSVAILVWQYLSYFAPGGQSAVVFAPLLVMGHYATNLGPKFLMSILLPMMVLLVYRRQALTEPAMQLAWLQFAFAAGYTYLLAETREPLAGNFAWTGQIATYLLFTTSTVFALRHWNGRSASVICALAFFLHAASGALFFVFPRSWGTIPPP